jgi:hypothetical protein
MKSIIQKISIPVLFAVIYSFASVPNMEKESVYNVIRLKQPMQIDAVWDKSQWKNIQPLIITNYMGDIPGFKPEAQAKMMYDDDLCYLSCWTVVMYARY